jgi:hypothetical protein
MRSRAAAAAIGAFVVQLFLTLATIVFPDPDDRYGAPLPVGTWMGNLLGGGRAEISWPLFAANVAITAALFWLALRRGASAFAVDGGQRGVPRSRDRDVPGPGIRVAIRGHSDPDRSTKSLSRSTGPLARRAVGRLPGRRGSAGPLDCSSVTQGPYVSSPMIGANKPRPSP